MLVLQLAKIPPADLLREIPAGFLPVRRAAPMEGDGWPLVQKLAKLPAPKRDFAPLLGGKPLTAAARRDALAGLAERGARLKLLARAVDRPVWNQPVEVPLGPDPYAQMQGARIYSALKDSVKALAARAELQADAGTPHAAADSLILARRAGDRLLASYGPSISYLVGVAITAESDRAASQLARHPKMTRAALERLLTGFPAPSASDEPLARTLAAEYRDFFVPVLADLDTTRESEPMLTDAGAASADSLLRGHPAPLDKKATVRLGLRPLGIALANTRRSWRAQVRLEPTLAPLRAGWPEWADDPDAEPTPAQVIGARLRLRPVSNPYGGFLVEQAFSTAYLLGSISFKRRADDGAARLSILLALAAKNGRTLATLPANVPDPFSGGPYRYDPKRGLLWSVGANGRDDGGRGKPGILSEPDLVYPVRGGRR